MAFVVSISDGVYQFSVDGIATQDGTQNTYTITLNVGGNDDADVTDIEQRECICIQCFDADFTAINYEKSVIYFDSIIRWH